MLLSFVTLGIFNLPVPQVFYLYIEMRKCLSHGWLWAFSEQLHGECLERACRLLCVVGYFVLICVPNTFITYPIMPKCFLDPLDARSFCIYSHCSFHLSCPFSPAVYIKILPISVGFPVAVVRNYYKLVGLK